MPLGDAYQAGTDAVLGDMIQRPRPVEAPPPSFSVWRTTKAAGRGGLAGVGQAMGSTVDVLGAFGQVLGSLGTEDWRMPDPEQARKQTEEARARLEKQGGPDFNSEGGRLFRNVAKDYMPDPVTAHGAEQAVGNLFRLGAKAVTAGAVLGPMAGAALAGAEEGFTTSDELGQQGVDLGTRSKVGALTAGLTAASFALPVAAPTVKGTIGLGLAGGPASFVAQQAATREILRNADYGALSNQYDPFDPVGLALSTVLPLGFGALAMRAGARGVKPADAPGKAGEPVATAAEPHGPPRPDAEAVDAARVNLLRENVDAHRLTPAEDLAGATAHSTAMGRAIDQMAAGERVAVSDVVPLAVAARAAEDLAPRLRQALDEVSAATRLAEPPPSAVLPHDAPTAVSPESVAGKTLAEPAPTAAADASQQASTSGASAVKLVSESPHVDRAVAEIESARPDMMVHLDGMDAPVKLSELMARVREELGQDLAESPLIEAAAACFLRTGGG